MQQHMIIIARQPDGRLTFIKQNDGLSLVKPGWEYIQVDRNLIPQDLTHAKLWDWLHTNMWQRIKLKLPEEQTESSTLAYLDAVKIKQVDRIKRMRADVFRKLDIEWHKANDAKDHALKSAVELRRQQIRELKINLDHLIDPEEVVDYFPIELTAPIVPRKPLISYTMVFTLIATAASLFGPLLYMFN